jgi:signal transduction histidine kinase
LGAEDQSLKRALIGLGIAGAFAGAVPLALAALTEGGHHRGLIAVFGPVIGWAFIATGILAWLRRPANRIGALMVAVGFTYCLSGLIVANEPALFTLGLLFIALPYAILVHILAAFPKGRLRGRADRAIVWASYFSATAWHWTTVALQDDAPIGLPRNVVQVATAPHLLEWLTKARFAFGIVLFAALGVILTQRYRASSHRRALTPVYLSGGLVLVLYGIWFAAGIAGVDPDVRDVLEQARVVALATVPFAFLGGLMRMTVAGLAQENRRLDAELQATIEELRASRARIVESADAARRRIERDLHDGAQQQIVSLALTLRLARAKLDDDPDATRELLDRAAGEAEVALHDLRELARGIHPAVLSDRGLDSALEALANRLPLPVEIGPTPAERLPEPVEAAAYFVVAEAMTNVAKYADATHASVQITRDNGAVVVEVSDDGVGGADPAKGSGLRGLADRVAALDGRLEVDSPSRSGTTVRAVIPCSQDATRSERESQRTGRSRRPSQSPTGRGG